MAGALTPCTSLVWRTQSLMPSHDGSRRLATVTSTRPGPMYFLAPTDTGDSGRRRMLRRVGSQLVCLSVAPSSQRTYRSWNAFRGLIGEVDYFDAAASDEDRTKYQFHAAGR